MASTYLRTGILELLQETGGVPTRTYSELLSNVILRRWPRRLRKLLRLRPQEHVDLIRAQTALLRAQWLVWVRPVGKLVTSATPSIPPAATLAAAMPVAMRLATAVHRAADHGLFRPQCLVRAVALDQLLKSFGIQEGRVRVGVRLQGGQFVAHAWVEYAEHVLADREEHVRQFTPLSDIHLVARL